MNIDVKYIIIFLLAILFSTFPVFLIKIYNSSNNYIYVILAILCYISLVFTYIFLLKDVNLSNIYTSLKIGSVISVVLVGIFLFNQKENICSFVGIFLGIISIYFLS